MRRVDTEIAAGQLIRLSLVQPTTDEVIAGYDAPFPVPEARIGIVQFPELVATGADHPSGPAMLAVESAPTTSDVGVRRSGIGRYIGRIQPIAVPPDGSRRERVEATVASLARAFERIVEDAPDQWWAIFFPIWPETEAAA